MRYLSYISSCILACFLFSCTEDLDVKPGIVTSNDDVLRIEFLLPEAEHVITRANDNNNERKINNLSIFVCDENNKILKRIDETTVLDKIQAGFDSDSRSYTYQLPLPSNFNYSKVYAVANTQVTASKDLLTELEKGEKFDLTTVSENLHDKEDAFLMSGELDTSNKTLSLTRVAAKITLKDESENEGFSLINWGIYNVAEKSYVMAPVKTDSPFYNTINENSQTITGVIDIPIPENKTIDDFTLFAPPTKTHIGLKVYTYVVLKASYQGKPYYYAVPLYNSEKKEDENYYYDIEPNHWYDMRIIKVVKEGSKSPKEAIDNHNDNQIWVEIHDHVPDVFSMVTDGIHELGVNRLISLKKTGDVLPTATLKVKCFAADVDRIDTSNLKDLTKSEIQLVPAAGSEWIDIKIEGEYPKVVVNEYTGGKIEDNDNPGLQIEYLISVDPNHSIYAEETGSLYVRWKGLEREVTVTYDPGISLNQVCKVTFSIDAKGESDNVTIKDYWTFIKGEGKKTTLQEEFGFGDQNTPILYGITSDVLTDNKQRTNGFHFPMPYGDNYNSTPWEYKYDIDFSPLEELVSKGEITGLTWNIVGDSFITKYVYFQPEEKGGKLTMVQVDPEDLYTYAGGTITFKVSFKESQSPTEVKLSLYHTGFFHYDGNDTYLPEGEKGFYYYEVIEIEENNHTYHWLDRNLGAKSNLMFVDDENGGLGASKARGRYYTVATYAEYADPTILKKLCPPGYHIPATGEWNDLRLSARFTSGNEAFNESSYTASYYETGNPKIGKLYFPRSRYYYDKDNKDLKVRDTPNNGDASVGYYWTVTAAPGMEKLDMGRWLRALYLNGEASTYLNTNIEESKMNVRCLAGNKPAEQDNNYISFNVHNATHVYLFDNETKSALYTFPGKALGSAMSSEQWQYFSCTTAYSLENLLVLFVKVGNDGKVTIYTRDGEKFDETYTFSTDLLNSKKAWEIHRGYYYDFCQSALDRLDPCYTLEKPDECDALGENNGGGGSGNGDGDNNKGGNETQRGSENQPGKNEIKLWEGTKTVNWDETDVEFDKWKFVPVGSKLRIYGTSNGDGMVGIRGKGWNNYLGTADGYFQYNGVNGYVEIELTQALLNDIINKGMMFTGANFTVTYITLILEGGEYLTPEKKSGKYDWSGWVELKDGSFDELSELYYDWTKAPNGGTLSMTLNIYWTDAFVRLTNGNNNRLSGFPQDRTFSSSGDNQVVTIEIPASSVTDLVNNGGLIIKCFNLGVRRVTFTPK